MSPTTSLVTAEDRNRVAGLQLLARQVVEGVTVGIHRSPHKGFSVEFKEHRPYVVGDEIRMIDWKLFGKTDRLFIRQYEEETNLRCTLLVDQSGSMSYGGTRSLTSSKHDYAIRLAACLAYLLIGQQDSVGLALIDQEVRKYIPPRSRPNHLSALFDALGQSQPAGETGLHGTLRMLAPKLRRRGLLVLLSDCFDKVDSLLSALAGFRHARNEVMVFHILDPDELDFPFRGRTEFRSLEKSSDRRQLDPNYLRQAYLKNFESFRQQLSQGCGKQKIDLVTTVTDQPYADVIADFLLSRGRIR